MSNQKNQIASIWSYFFVILLAMGVGVWSLLSNPERNDLLGALIQPNLPALIPQSILLVFLMWQVLTYKPIANLVAIRQQSEFIEKSLLRLVISETTLYFLIYYGLFFLSGIQPFIDGTPLLGSLILILRYVAMIILSIIIVGAYRYWNPGLLITLTLLLNLAYHYWIELSHLLIIYSPLYDPLYRAVHHIYRG